MAAAAAALFSGRLQAAVGNSSGNRESVLPRKPTGRRRPRTKHLTQNYHLPKVIAIMRADGVEHLQLALFGTYRQTHGKEIALTGLCSQLVNSSLETSNSLFPFFLICRG